VQAMFDKLTSAKQQQQGVESEVIYPTPECAPPCTDMYVAAQQTLRMLQASSKVSVRITLHCAITACRCRDEPLLSHAGLW
jgi:hypothetical protein